VVFTEDIIVDSGRRLEYQREFVLLPRAADQWELIVADDRERAEWTKLLAGDNSDYVMAEPYSSSDIDF
jgi:hypothetical protein